MVKAQRCQTAKCGKPKKERGSKEKQDGVKKGRGGVIELKRKKKRDKKDLHRNKKKKLAVSDGDALDCCVLLTRLEEKAAAGKEKNALKAGKKRSVKVKKKQHSIQRGTKHRLKKTSVANQQALEPKNNQSDALLMMPSAMFEPRRRRMASLNAEAVNSLLLYKGDSLMANNAKKCQPSNEEPAKELTKTEHGDQKTKKGSLEGKAVQKERPKKQKRSTAEAQNIDWLSLLAPTPRRQAGLTAATLLKLTSAPYGAKRQRKVESKPGSRSEAAATTQDGMSGKPVCKGTTHTKRRTHPKHEGQLKHRKQGTEDPVHSQVSPAIQECCSLWGQECVKHPLHCGSSLGFSLKTIKEEQVETEVSSCYCCSQERCVEYFHRLALFLDDKTFKEPEDGYYVHFSHPDNSASTISPLALCPSGSKRPKLLPSTGPQPSGISHPVYCCTSVKPCYGEPCRINGYSAYTSVIPAINRGACSSGPTDCIKCNHSVKRGNPSSIPICPSPRILTGCPVPTVPPAGQSVPHIQTPLSDPSQPQPPLKVAKECPQSAKQPSGSRSGARSTGSISSAVCPLNRNKKQKLSCASDGGQTVAKQPKNGRQKSTNGWRPFGLSFEKEVFSVGEDTLVLRKCFEGVHRDGELIRVRDTVLLKSGPRKKSLPYVAKVSALWEEPESGELMMSLLWYYRPEHTQGGRNPSVHCENEVFASRHQDVNSVACIEDKCYVLTLAQYCRFCALVKRRREGVSDSAASLVVPPVVGNAMPTHHCVPDDTDPELVFFCRHVYDFRYGRLLKNLQ
uniref:BAH domain-containing protein n=1 Tax=Astatotilapia calliptera TaxID=8154 RepID=A0A3P8QHA5_ASTCA